MNDNRKIGVIVTYPKSGQKHSNFNGIAGYTKNLLDNMPEEARSKIVVFSNMKEKAIIFEENLIKVDECWERNSLSYWIDIIKAINKYPGLEIIHLQHEFNLFGGILTIPLNLLLFGLLNFFLNKKVVVTFHGVISQKNITRDFIESNNLKGFSFFIKISFKLYYRLASLFLDTVIAHEKYFSDILEKEYKYKKDIVIIPHGVENFKQTLNQIKARQLLGINKEKKVILYFGFLAGYKGIDLLIKSFNLLDDSYFLILAGGKPSRVQNNLSYNKWYQQFRRILESKKNILATGFVKEEDIEKYFIACDVVVFPYKVAMSSSGPMSFAIGYEKPFLASDVFSEILPKEMIFKRTPKDLARKLEEFFNDQEEIKKDIKEMKEKRLWNQIGNQTYEIYK